MRFKKSEAPSFFCISRKLFRSAFLHPRLHLEVGINDGRRSHSPPVVKTAGCVLWGWTRQQQAKIFNLHFGNNLNIFQNITLLIFGFDSISSFIFRSSLEVLWDMAPDLSGLSYFFKRLWGLHRRNLSFPSEKWKCFVLGQRGLKHEAVCGKVVVVQYHNAPLI